MARVAYNTPASNATNELFRHWARSLHNAIKSCSLAEPDISGAIDFETVNAPGGINQSQGYRVYAFADALQGTLPVFIKVEFGEGSSADEPGIWLTVGTTNDESGTLGGQTYTRTQLQGGIPGDTDQHTSYVAGDTNYLCVNPFLWDNVNRDEKGNFGFAIERSHDVDGNDTSYGIIVLHFFSSGQEAMTVLPITGSVLSAETEYRGMVFSITNPSWTGKTVVGRVYAVAAISPGPLKSVVVLGTNIINSIDFITVAVYDGQPLTYVYLGDAMTSIGGVTNGRMAMRWD